MDQKKWLSKNSPYRLHKSSRREFGDFHCCGIPPQEKEAWIHHLNPKTDCLEWFPLYQCPQCQSMWITLDGAWKKIPNLLRYERRGNPFPEK